MTDFDNALLNELLSNEDKLIALAVMSRCVEANIICVEDRDDKTEYYNKLRADIANKLKFVNLRFNSGRDRKVASTLIEFQVSVDLKVTIINQFIEDRYL